MASVPRISGPGVAPAGLPNVQQASTVNAALLDAGNRQVGELGGALVQAGSAYDQAMRIEVERANAIRVDQAVNQAQETAIRLQHDPKEGYVSLKGYDALNRPDGLPLFEEFTGKLDQSITEIGDGLSNPRQRELFRMRANNIRTSFIGNASTYQGQQAEVYETSVLEASAKNAADTLVLAQTPEQVEQQAQRLRASWVGGTNEDGVFIPGIAQRQGKSAAWGEQRAAEGLSNALGQSVKRFIENGDLQSAQAYRQRYGANMLPKDMLEVDGILMREAQTRQGQVAATTTMQAAQPALAPTTFDRILQVRTNLESGTRGDFGKDGQLLKGPVTRSGEQALGSAQVMPSTARDPGYGIKPADLTGTPQQQAAELKRVGDQKMGVLLKMFNGDVAKAFGAYNWGEGNVQKAQKQAQAAAGAGEVVPPDAWLAYAPAETRKYVENAAKQLGSPTGGAPERPTLDQLQQQAVAQLGPNPSSLAVKNAREGVAQQFAAQEAGMKQRADEVVVRAQQELVANGGVWANVSPATRDAVTKLAPGEIDNLMGYGTKIQSGQPVETDWNAYSSLRALAATNPLAFGKTDLRTYFPKLAPAQREQLLDLQTKAKDPKSVPEVATLEAQLGNAKDSLKLGAGDAEKRGKFDSFVTSQIAAEQKEKGRPLTYEERQKVIDRAMLPTNSGWFGGKRSYEVAGTPEGLTARPVPQSDDKKLIVAALQAEGIKNPTDAQILQRFNLAKGIR